jgi:hypothetical protein
MEFTKQQKIFAKRTELLDWIDNLKVHASEKLVLRTLIIHFFDICEKVIPI